MELQTPAGFHLTRPIPFPGNGLRELLEIFGLRVALPVSLDQGRQPVLPVPELYRQLFDARVALRDLLLEVLLRVVVAQLVALRDSRFEVAANVFELPLQLIACS